LTAPNESTHAVGRSELHEVDVRQHLHFDPIVIHCGETILDRCARQFDRALGRLQTGPVAGRFFLILAAEIAHIGRQLCGGRQRRLGRRGITRVFLKADDLHKAVSTCCRGRIAARAEKEKHERARFRRDDLA
jgi:hypothetical protein